MMTENPKIACFLCGQGVEIRQSKREKPYFICLGCGVQAFIRGEQGRRLLEEKINPGTLMGGKNRMSQLIGQLLQLKAQLEELKRQEGFWDFLEGNRELKIAQEAVGRQIRKIEEELNAG